jgi:regulator of replication initiation timing
MAQDFQAAFGLDGADDKHISVVDEGGVALAAIQGLNQKLEETRADNAALRADNADLRARLEKLERLLQPSN